MLKWEFVDAEGQRPQWRAKTEKGHWLIVYDNGYYRINFIETQHYDYTFGKLKTAQEHIERMEKQHSDF